MKTKENKPAQQGIENVKNVPGKSSLPKGNENNAGVTNGVGISRTSDSKKNTAGNRKEFSGERHIF